MFNKERVRIDSCEIGNIGDAVSFKLITSEGDMNLNMNTESARSMINLLQQVVDKIESGQWKSDDSNGEEDS